MPFPQRNKKLVAARTQNAGSFVPLQFPLSPMMVFAIGIEHANDVAVERFHDADARHHCRAVEPRDKHQYFHRRLPFRRFVLGLRKLCDVLPGILQGDELATPRQRDWLIEFSRPTALNDAGHRRRH
jgi:hypothetical protein